MYSTPYAGLTIILMFSLNISLQSTFHSPQCMNVVMTPPPSGYLLGGTTVLCSNDRLPPTISIERDDCIMF